MLTTWVISNSAYVGGGTVGYAYVVALISADGREDFCFCPAKICFCLRKYVFPLIQDSPGGIDPARTGELAMLTVVEVLSTWMFSKTNEPVCVAEELVLAKVVNREDVFVACESIRLNMPSPGAVASIPTSQLSKTKPCPVPWTRLTSLIPVLTPIRISS